MVFYQECYLTAKDVLNKFGVTNIDDSELANQLITFHTQIEEIQRKNFTPDLVRLLPEPIPLIANYIDWLVEQEWIDNYQIKMFNIDDGRFTNFRRYAAKLDNFERDPLTGCSTMRG
jgi:hypothetical protein